jgi:predicted P-loop ATPase
MTTNVGKIKHTPKNKDVAETGVINGKERFKVPVSIVKGINPKILKIKQLGELFEVIKKDNSDFYDQSQVIQKLATDNPLEYKKQKETSLNGFLVGEFSKRSKKDIVKYIPLLVFDFDYLDPDQYLEILAESINSPYIFACFPSPSYLGCRLMVWTNATPETHTNIYKNIQLHFKGVFGLPIGGKKGTPQIDKGTSDYSRFWCFTAVGNDIYLNENSRNFLNNQCFDFVSKAGSVKLDNEVKQPDTKPTPKPHDPLTENQKFSLLDAIVNERKKQRNCTIFDLACMLFEHGLNDDQVLYYCNGFEETDFDKKEIQTTVQSASKKALKGVYNDNQLLSYGNKILGYQAVNDITNRVVQTNGKTALKVVKNTPFKVSNVNEPDNETNNTPEPPTITKTAKITQIRNYLNSKYDFRYNIVSNEIECKTKDKTHYDVLNENNVLVELMECGLNGVEKPLIALLKSDFTPKYDPIQEYCKNLPKWTPEQPDYITELANYVKAKDQHWFNGQFKKVLVRTLSCSLGRIAFNKQCFTLVGGQNAGKSSFIRFLCPKELSKHITDDIDFQNKDGRISLCTNMIINLDELDGMPRKEVAQVKKFMTIDRVKARLPYDRTDSYLERRASFFASTNESDFLTDTTGNVRWLVFPINTIIHDNGGGNGYTQNIDISLVYSQAFYLLNNSFNYLVTKEDLEKSEINNKSHMVQSIEQDFIQQYLEPSDKDNGAFANTGDLFKRVQILAEPAKLNFKKFGEALRVLGFEPSSHRVNGSPRKGYFINFVKEQSINFS